MKAVLTGGLVMVVISVGSYFALGEMGFSAQDVYSGDNVRLD
ncbi:MAG: hypothetical protein AAF340_16145 [Pseudomonadota bacterium]